ncbi:MAG: tRNA nucleotidyltransferase (CCA-adding enzyme) [Myxococcota bacterium]|jgi:tRNA nucleotidyltransferase (CCA-adding enzyme)
MSELIAHDLTEVVPPELVDAIFSLQREAAERGMTLFLVGGPVRDWLLGARVVDVDLLVAGGRPRDAVELARAALGEDVEIREHPRFGTAKVSLGAHTIDLGCMRKEHYEQPGVLPKVSPGTLEDDMRRRDFAINALAVPLLGDGRLTVDSVLDLVGGLEDLGDRTLRVLHERSFHDDPTRALRAARFCARLDGRLARGSRSYLRDALRDGSFGAVSGDRLRQEFERLFADVLIGGDASKALASLDRWHVLSALEPGLGYHKDANTPLRRLAKLLVNPPWRLRDNRPWVSGLYVWLATLPPAMRRRVVSRLSVRGEVGNRLVDFAPLRKKAIRSLEGARGRGAVDVVLGELDEEQLLALCASCTPAVRRRVVRWAGEDRDRRIPVTGRDLVKATVEGPVVGIALSRIRAAYLDGEVANREEAMALAREIVRRSTRKLAKAKPKSKRTRTPKEDPTP